METDTKTTRCTETCAQY